jgi:myosin heavy subunit
MNLKDLFDKAEGGVLTYDQLMAAAKESNSKFVDLSEGKYVDKQKYDDDLSARDTRIKTLDDTLKTRDTDLGNLRSQLEAAGTDADKLSKLTTDFTDLQSKYDKDTKAYEKQLKDQAYKYAVKEFTDKLKFTSQAAKRDFVNSMMAKNFTIENDVIVGATDFVAAYTKENEDTFVVDTPATPPTVDKPHFVEPTAPTGTPAGTPNPFNFNFTGVRPKS